MGRILLCLLASLLVVSVWSAKANALELLAMAPDPVGLTVQKSPVLYFFISPAIALPIRFTLIDNHKFTPEVEVLLRSPTRPGLWAIRMEDYHIVLEKEVQYRWYVSVLQDPDLPQRNIVAGGAIERIDPRRINYDDRLCDKDTVRYLGRPAFGTTRLPVLWN